jgi:hypothetical protein
MLESEDTMIMARPPRRDFLRLTATGAAFTVLPARGARAQGGELSVGALYPLTGPAAAFGIQQSNGLKLAAQFVNQEGGVKGRQIKFVFGDATNNATAVAGAERLVQSGVPLIFGTASSGLSLAASPVAERAGVVYVETGALNAALTNRGFKNYFRTRANNDIFARRAIAITKEVIAPKLGKQPAQMTAVVLHESPRPRTSRRSSSATRARSPMSSTGRHTPATPSSSGGRPRSAATPRPAPWPSPAAPARRTS